MEDDHDVEREACDRKKSFKHLVGVDKEGATTRRREQSVQISKAGRNKAITAKRFKRDPEHASLLEATALPEDDWTEAQVVQVVSLLQALHPGPRSEALQQLRRLLSSSDPPLTLIVELGTVPLLIRFLTEQSPVDRLAAAWCLTNVAAGSHEHTQATLSATPFLINFLTQDDPALQEQAAWAIANMAGDSVESRDIVRAQGALPPMIQLLYSKHASVVQTAAFALCNLIRGQNPRINEAFDAGMLPALFLVLAHPVKEVIVEALWLLSYITAYGEPFLRPLMEQQLAPRLVDLLPRGIPEAILPLLRVVGNLISRSNAYTDALLNCAGFLPFLAHCIGSEARPVRKEGMWVVSNLSGGTLEHVQAIVKSGLGDLIVQAFKTQPFDIKKEAGFALMNIGSEKQTLVALVQGGVVPVFLALLKVPDLEAVTMALDFVALLLRHYPEGALVVEEEDGLETLENLQYHQYQTIADKATRLVRQFYREGDDGNDDYNERSVQ